MSERKKLAIIDGKSVLYRGYYAMTHLANRQGKPTGATYGFAMMALKVVNDVNPDYVIVAWDKSKTNTHSRRKMYKDYKANRKPMPEDMREQIPDVRRLCEALSWPFLEIDDYEADDIMGTLGEKGKKEGLDIVMVTSDLDTLQLVNGHTSVLALKTGLSKTISYNEQKIQEEFGMTPTQFSDYKALRGDPSDNIPGVAGVGEKTAKELIIAYKSLDNVYKHLADIKPAVAAKLKKDKDMAYLSRDLVRIICDLPIDLDLEAADVKDSNPIEIEALFNELGFRRLKEDLPEWMRPTQGLFAEGDDDNDTINNHQVKPINIKEHNSKLELKEALVVTLEDKALVSPNNKEAYIVDINDLKVSKIIGFHAKDELKKLKHNEEVSFDITIAAFLLNPLLRRQTFPELVQDSLSLTVPDIKRSDDIDKIHSGESLTLLWQLHDHYRSELTKVPKLKKVAEVVEWPLIPVIAKIETVGVKLDSDYLADMSEDFAGRIKELEGAIYKQAGQEFNINSPNQLQAILFEKLNLSTEGIKKTKSGYSTGASELQKLWHLHPIINLISHYRELNKLKGTYIDALPKLVDANGRLHTTLTQTVAQTGRLSSLNPNLQNIPIRTEEGRAIRRAFIADEGNTLINADYSQFELRLAAILSGDEQMIAAFNDSLDIHAQTSAQLYGIDIKDVTKEQRYNAKAVNFGVMYGMSPHGLSISTGMSRDEAKDFIDKYFKIRPKLYEYLESLKKQAKKEGYVETILGRRRPMPDIKSANLAVRATAERAAINMPIQGSAADLMKLAMIEVDKLLDDDSRQILQIHDSILIECPKDKAEDVAKQVERVMENIRTDLSVKLEVDTVIGDTWADLG
ncbi:MAG: DNA polymerase I [Candidatus Saccharimonadales bacterium]